MTDQYYELMERIAILLENNTGLSEDAARRQAEREIEEREPNG